MTTTPARRKSHPALQLEVIRMDLSLSQFIPLVSPKGSRQVYNSHTEAVSVVKFLTNYSKKEKYFIKKLELNDIIINGYNDQVISFDFCLLHFHSL